MADPRLSQQSFTAGEISPELYAREDLQRYNLGAKFVENFFIRPHGGVANRAGMRFVCEVKDSTKFTRLMSFEAAADDAYILEAGNLYYRPIFHGVQILSGGSPYEITTPYPEATLLLMYMEQSNDVATIAHPDYAVRELSRISDTNWTLSTVTFQPLVSAPTGVSATGTEGYTGYDASHLQTYKNYVVSAIGADGEESLPSSEAQSDIALVLGYEQNYVTVTWSSVSGATEYIVYKEVNGIFGFIGETVDLTFKDDNINPDFSDGPQAGANPFNSTGNYPSLVTFCQQRRVFAATDNDPQTVWMSQSGNFKNMGVSSPAKDDDSVEFTLAARRKQDIFHMIPLEKGMLMYTRSGEWRVTGRDGNVITPSSILTEPQSYYGCSALMKPLVVGENILFVMRSENKVMDMQQPDNATTSKYVAEDRTILAEHLFRGRTIIAWDYAGQPDGIIWCVMSDGTALSLTYLKEHQVWGWSRHKTAGKYLDVKVVPEATRDTPYFIVQRLIGGSWVQYIEYLEDRQFDDVRDAFFVDSGLSLDNPVAVESLATGATTTITITGHGLSDGDPIDLDGAIFYDLYSVAQARIDGRYIVTNKTANTFEIYDVDGNPVDTSAYSTGYYLDNVYIRAAYDTVSGLDHLIGRTVVALADGNVLTNLVVDGTGAVSLGDAYSRVHVGLPFTAKLETLDLSNPQLNDTGLRKAIARSFLQVYKTVGIKYGTTFDDLVEVAPRQFEEWGEPSLMKSEPIEAIVWADYDVTQTLCVVQDQPLPATILSVTEEISYGG